MECPHPHVTVSSSCLSSLKMSKTAGGMTEDQQQCPQTCRSLRVFCFFFFPSEVSQVLQFLLLIAIGSKRDSLVNYLHLFRLPIYSSFNESLSVAMCTLRHPCLSVSVVHVIVIYLKSFSWHVFMVHGAGLHRDICIQLYNVTAYSTHVPPLLFFLTTFAP